MKGGFAHCANPPGKENKKVSLFGRKEYFDRWARLQKKYRVPGMGAHSRSPCQKICPIIIQFLIYGKVKTHLVQFNRRFWLGME